METKNTLNVISDRIERIKNTINDSFIEPLIDFNNKSENVSTNSTDIREIIPKKYIDFVKVINELGGKLLYIKSGSTGHTFKGVFPPPNDKNKTIDLASLMEKIKDQSYVEDPNIVKVIVDSNSNAMYFSRSAIPYNRLDKSITYYKHVGVYAFRKSFLTKFSNLKIGVLEAAEKIEALRMVENGIAIKMIESDEKFIGIDTLEDLEMARKMINEKGSI